MTTTSGLSGIEVAHPAGAGGSRRTITKAAFEELRDTELGLEAALGITYPAEHGFDPFEMRFGQLASWAVWAEPVSGVTGTGWSRDKSVLARYEDLAGIIHADVIFVALNKGKNPIGQTETDWANFHSGRRDYTLAQAIRAADGGMAKLWGAYMTDLYKGLPTRTGTELAEWLDSTRSPTRDQVEKTMCDLLEKEIAILGARDPLLVCLGVPTYAAVSRLMPQRRSVRLTHYSYRQLDPDKYAAELAALCRTLPTPTPAAPHQEAGTCREGDHGC